MKQILHIFRKDVRRLWIEILLSVVAAALFAWVIPKSWMVGPIWMQNPYQEIAVLANLLLPLSWGLLIARLIHGEVLVGDRQFWITRPYEWPKLLAAKVLFIALFVYLPFLLMEVSILWQAGFSPLSYVPGIFYRLLLISLVFFPLIGLATVTSNLARMVLTLLGIFVIFLFLVSGIAFSTRGDSERWTFSPVPWGGIVTVAFALLVCGAVIVLQYARRRVVVARLLLGSTPFLVLLVSWLCNTGLTVDHAYPAAAQIDASVIRMIPFDQDDRGKACFACSRSESEHSVLNNMNPGAKKWAVIKVKVRSSGVAAGDRWQLDAFRPTLTPASGAPLKLDWQQGQQTFDKPDQPNSFHYEVLDVLIPRADYERLKSSPLTLHLDFALTEARPAWSRQFPLPEGKFMIPEFASCATMANRPVETLGILAVDCRFPLRAPQLTTVSATETIGPCGAAPAQTADRALPVYETVLGDFDTAPADFGISPMEERQFLGSPNNNAITIINGKTVNDAQASRLCPGTPVVVTQYRKVRAVQTGMTIENYRLAAQ